MRFTIADLSADALPAFKAGHDAATRGGGHCPYQSFHRQWYAWQLGYTLGLRAGVVAVEESTYIGG